MNNKLIIVLAAMLFAAPMAVAHDPPQPVTVCEDDAEFHDVGVFGGADAKHADEAHGGGLATVQDGNLADCNGDGSPADYDCETEFGIGGGRFAESGLLSYSTDPDTGLTNSDCTGDGHHSLQAGFTSSFVSTIIQSGTDGASNLDPALDCDGLISPSTNPNDWLSETALASPTATVNAAPDWGCDRFLWVFASTGLDTSGPGTGVGIGHAFTV